MTTQDHDQDLLITNGHVADVVQGALSDMQDLRVVAGRIVEIERSIPPRDGERVLDAAGGTVMPGLIDAHVHAVDYTPNRFLGYGYSPYYVGARALGELRGMLSRGFTTVRDAGGADSGLARAIAEGHAVGPRLLVSGRPISQTGGHGDARIGTHGPCNPTDHHMMGRIADGVPAVLRAVRDELRMGANQIKIMAGGGIDSPADHVTSWQYTEDELRAAVGAAQACGTYVLAHAYSPESIIRSVGAGVRSIEHGNLLNANAAEAMAAAQAFLVPTLVVYESMVGGVGPEFDAPAPDVSFKEIFERGFQAIELAIRAGVRVAFGTDLCGGAQHRQLFELELRCDVLTPAEVIRSATATAAELIGHTGDLGVVEVGAVADLLIVSGDPFSSIATLVNSEKHLQCVVQAGRVIDRAGLHALARRVP